MTNEHWPRWAVAKHFREKGYRVNMNSLKVGNAAIDGEVIGKHWRMAIEIKSGHDDVIRGLGQLSAALAHGCNSAVLVVSLCHAKKLNLATFNKRGIGILGVDSKAHVNQVYP
jgi:hypothetical protein